MQYRSLHQYVKAGFILTVDCKFNYSRHRLEVAIYIT